ncbi:MFS transporter [Chloroflexi bacterium TSY]|nr:MFS transporter [Chloroflexi bacterium TSY]
MNQHFKQPRSLRTITTIILLTRLILSSSSLLFFPFLPFIASGLNITEVELGRYLGLSRIANLFAPIFGITADKRGYRQVIQIGLLMAATGNFLVYFGHSLILFMVGLFLIGAGSAGVAPTLGAYMSNILPFKKRSRGLGMLEYTYALTSIVVLPIFGWLMGWTSWRSPFLLTGILTLVTILGFYQLPCVTSGTKSNTSSSAIETVRDFLDFGANWRSATAVLASDSLTKMSGILLNINFGTWLAREYGLGIENLGQVAFILGVADICGSGLVSIFGDRIGKQRSVLTAAALGVFFYGALPLWNQGMVFALIGIVLARWTFEFSIVSHIVLASEQAPMQRGKMMTMRMGLGFFTGIIGAIVGPMLYERFGVWGISIPGAVSMLSSWSVTRFLTVERG